MFSKKLTRNSAGHENYFVIVKFDHNFLEFFPIIVKLSPRTETADKFLKQKHINRIEIIVF